MQMPATRTVEAKTATDDAVPPPAPTMPPSSAQGTKGEVPYPFRK